MTQDYKDTLLRYLTGNLNKETGVNEPQFQPVKTEESIINDFIKNNISGSWNVIDIIQGYQSNYSVIYGNDHNKRGFIVILNENMEPLQFINTYSSGTSFSEFKVLNVDEEGKFYGIDIKSSTPRFIMLNNIVLKLPNQSEFSVKLRQSYNLPSPLSTASKYFAITKSVGQPKYLIGGTIIQNNEPYQIATELTINVGSTNDWVNYQDTTAPFEGQCMWASWNEDVVSFKIGGYVAQGSLFYVEYQKIGSAIGKWNMELPIPNGYSEGNYSINTVILNESTAYVGMFDGGEYQTLENISFYKINYSTETADLLESINNSITIQKSSNDRIKFKITNGIVFFIAKRYEVSSGNTNIWQYSGIILGNNVYYTYGISENGDIENYFLCVSNIYNLYNYYVVGLEYGAGERSGNDFFIQQIYNANNYNGESYENINSLVPNSGVLYDSNGNILFARNLYNKSVYGNTTLSELQIPNTMVNDITIDMQNLIGETNKILCSNQENITKNIFETLYLNFYNTLTIQNRNTQDYITNQLASERLNQSTSMATDYDSIKATKYRINYVDNTNMINYIIPTITNNIAIYSFSIYVPNDNLILSIDLISEDEATIFQTITGLTILENGKTYNITQECYVE